MKPRLNFPPGSLVTHLLFKRGVSTVLKKSIREHMQVDIGDYIVIRAVSPGVVMLERLSVDHIDKEKEQLVISSYKSRMPPSDEEGKDI